MSDNIDKKKQEEFYTNLFRELRIRDFLEDENTIKKRGAPVGFDLPKIEPIDEPGKNTGLTPPPIGNNPPIGAPPPPLGGAGPIKPPPIGGGVPPIGGGLPGGVPPIGGAPIAPPIGGGILPVPPVESKKDDTEELGTLLESLDDLDDTLTNLQHDVKLQKAIEKVEDKYHELEDEINKIKETRVPEREYFDTEGAYKEHLFGMVCEVLDDYLPELFEDLPDYSFLSSQISRTFKDGTIADAMVSLYVTVPKGKDRYDFKLEVPILNGLIYKPLYIERGLRIIPLSKREIMRELSSMTYRKTDLEFETPYEKEQLFSNIGDNPHRRPDNQKVYNVRGNDPRRVGLPPKHTWSMNSNTDFSVNRKLEQKWRGEKNEWI